MPPSGFLLRVFSLALLAKAGLAHAEDGAPISDRCTESYRPVPDDFVPRSSIGFSAVAYLFRDDRRGLQVRSVTPDSAADRAGLEVDDLILSINEEPIAYENTLEAVLDLTRLEVGVPLRLEVLRNGVATTIELTVGAMAPGFAESVLAWVERAEEGYRRSDCATHPRPAVAPAAPAATKTADDADVTLSAAEWETLEQLTGLLRSDGAVHLGFVLEAGEVVRIHSSSPASFLAHFESPEQLSFLARMVDGMLESDPSLLAERASGILEVQVRPDAASRFALELLPTETPPSGLHPPAEHPRSGQRQE